jgi:hypothetical protein
MPDQNDSDPIAHNFLSPKDMQNWAEEEMKDSAKAHELRVKELKSLVADYNAAKVTPEEADDRMLRYGHRWGEALRGASAQDHLSDEQIVAKIDSLVSTRRPYTSRREASEGFRRIFGRHPDDDVPSR